MTYTQMVYINDEHTYGPTELTADEMVKRLAQICFFKQVGHQYTLDRDIDDKYNVTAYHIRFTVPERDGHPEYDVHQVYTIAE